MPQNTNINIPALTWTLLTNADVSSARVQNVSGYRIKIQGTVGAVAPTSDEGSIFLMPSQGFNAEISLSDIFPGVSGVNRLYAFCETAVPVSVSHV